LKGGPRGLSLSMKELDTLPETQKGKFVEGSKPLGTVTEAMVVRRAKEIATINGREPDQYTQDDYNDARCELTGVRETDEAADENRGVPATGEWLADAGGRGGKVPARNAGDEQQVSEELVREGVDEATHNQMLAGNRASRNAP
jgi:hypothetical protein